MDPLIISAGLGLVGSALNVASQQNANKMNREAVERANAEARRQALEDRAHDEAFNSPSAQRRRLEEAGLSPYAYDVSSVAKTQSQAPQVGAPTTNPVDFSGFASGIQSAFSTEIQRDQLAESKRQFDLDREQKAYQFAEQMARHDTELSQKAEQLAIQKKESEARISKISAELIELSDKHDVSLIEKAQKAESLLSMQFATSKLEEEYELSRNLKIADLSLKQLGVKQARLETEISEKTKDYRIDNDRIAHDMNKIAALGQKIQSREQALTYVASLKRFGVIDDTMLRSMGFGDEAIKAIDVTLGKIELNSDKDRFGHSNNPFFNSFKADISSGAFTRDMALKYYDNSLKSLNQNERKVSIAESSTTGALAFGLMSALSHL